MFMLYRFSCTCQFNCNFQFDYNGKKTLEISFNISILQILINFQHTFNEMDSQLPSKGSSRNTRKRLWKKEPHRNEELSAL